MLKREKKWRYKCEEETRRRNQLVGLRRIDGEVLKQTAAQDQDQKTLLHYSRVPVGGGQANLHLDLMAGTAKEGPSVDSATPYLATRR